MRDYGKLIWAVLGAVVFFLQAALQEGMAPGEWVGVAITVVNVVIIWMAPDVTIAPQVKAWIGAVLAGLLIAETAIVGGFTVDEWFDIGIAVLTAAGVIMDPRRPVHQIQRSSTVAGTPPREAY